MDLSVITGVSVSHERASVEEIESASAVAPAAVEVPYPTLAGALTAVFPAMGVLSRTSGSDRRSHPRSTRARP